MLTRKVTHVRFGQKVVFGYCRRHGDICRGQFATPGRFTSNHRNTMLLPVLPALPFRPPFTGALDFTSKYEGSDSARATLNPQADQAFHEQTKAITELEKVVSQVVTGFARDGNPARADCVVNGLDAWARAGALTAVAKKPHREIDAKVGTGNALIVLAAVEILPCASVRPTAAKSSRR